MARVYRTRHRRGTTSAAWAWVIGGIAVIVLLLIFAPLFSDDDVEPGVAEVGDQQVELTETPPPAGAEPDAIAVYTLLVDPNARRFAGQEVGLRDLRVTRKVSDRMFYVEPADVPGHRPFLIETDQARELYPNQIISASGTLMDPALVDDLASRQLDRDERLALVNAELFLDADDVEVAPETQISRNQPTPPTARDEEQVQRQ